MNLGAPELAIIAAILVLIFGGAKLPQLARSLGEARREFEGAGKATAVPATVPVATPTPVTVPVTARAAGPRVTDDAV